MDIGNIFLLAYGLMTAYTFVRLIRDTIKTGSKATLGEIAISSILWWITWYIAVYKYLDEKLRNYIARKQKEEKR